MMTRTNSTATARLKLALAIPALMALLILFSGSSFNRILAQTSNKESSNETDKKSEKVYQKVDVEPQYPGGVEALINFLAGNIKYPEEAKKLGIQGKVSVTFVIRPTGEVTDVKVLKGIGSGCDEESVRVIKMMPKWKPGEMKGKTVPVQYVLPISYTLDKDQKKKETK
jgi:TonB family protein